jgi:hypothetical protein
MVFLKRCWKILTSFVPIAIIAGQLHHAVVFARLEHIPLLLQPNSFMDKEAAKGHGVKLGVVDAMDFHIFYLQWLR